MSILLGTDRLFFLIFLLGEICILWQPAAAATAAAAAASRRKILRKTHTHTRDDEEMNRTSFD